MQPENMSANTCISTENLVLIDLLGYSPFELSETNKQVNVTSLSFVLSLLDFISPLFFARNFQLIGISGS